MARQRFFELSEKNDVTRPGVPAFLVCDQFTVGFPTEVVFDGRDALVAVGMNDEPLPFEHGFPARTLVPHLYFWKSAKWVRGIQLLLQDEPGFWESAGYHDYGDPWREQRYQGD